MAIDIAEECARGYENTLNPFFLRFFYLHEFRELLNNVKILSRELVKIIYCML